MAGRLSCHLKSQSNASSSSSESERGGEAAASSFFGFFWVCFFLVFFGLTAFFALAPAALEGRHDASGVNTGSGARRLRPVALSSSAKRIANTSSDTMGSSSFVRRTGGIAEGVETSESAIVPESTPGDAPPVTLGTVFPASRATVDVPGAISIARIRSRIDRRDGSPEQERERRSRV